MQDSGSTEGAGAGSVVAETRTAGRSDQRARAAHEPRRRKIWRCDQVVPVPEGLTVTPPGETVGMERQLVLIETADHDWRLDERTKEIGMRGVELARRQLREARRAALEDAARHAHPSAA